MIAQHDGRAFAQAVHEAQTLKRSRTTVDEIANQPQPVVCAVEINFGQECLKRCVATLQIADRISAHLRFFKKKKGQMIRPFL